MAKAKDVFKKMKKKYPSDSKVEYVKTESQVLNKVLGGGIPRGRLMRIWGPSNCGKTHISLSVCKAFIEAGDAVVFLDFEGGLDNDLIAGFGLDQYKGDSLFIHKDCHTFQDLVELLVSYGKVDDVGLIVVDSMAAVSEMKNADIEDEDEFNSGGMASKARLDSVFYKDYNGFIKKNNITFFQVEQQRTVLGGHYTYKKCRGGETALFYTDVQLRVRLENTYEEDGQVTAADLKIETEKNKTSALDDGIIPIRYGKGFDATLMLMQYLTSMEDGLPFFERAGAWYRIINEDGEIIEKFNGQDPLREYVSNNTEFFVQKLKECGVIS